MTKSRQIYLNRKQDQILHAPQLTKTGVWGRGTGKTTVIADNIYDYFIQMPRSKGFLLSKSFGQAYTKILPEIFDRLSMYGLKEHTGPNDPGHYVVCKVPPSWWGRPYKKPRKFDNIVTFINGTMMEILSFDRPDLGRGGSYDWCVNDEAALINYDVFTKTVRPLLRGNIKQWNHPRRFSMLIFTSRAWKSSGKWTETIMKQLAAEHPEKYFYSESSAKENIDILGADYFERQKMEMDPITYSVEIENQPISKLPNAYYQALDDETHLYDPEFSYEYDNLASWKISGDLDVDPELPLEPSFDFNAAFSSCTIWQDHRPETNELRCLRNFYVKYQTVEQLVDMICDHYRNHPTKEVNIFGGKDGLSKFKLYNDSTLYQRIAAKFTQRGWKAQTMVDISLADVAHKQKHLVIDNVLREINPQLPTVRINEQNAKETFMSMLHTPIKGDFQKDKSSERDENLPQEQATHLSDTVDNYVYPKTLKDYSKHLEQSGNAADLSIWTA
jgi:hypothetical protein